MSHMDMGDMDMSGDGGAKGWYLMQDGSLYLMMRDDRRELGREPPCTLDRLLELLVVGREVRDRAVLVAFRDVRAGEAELPRLVALAVAADHTTDAVLFERFPAGVVAEFAGHVQQRRLQYISGGSSA